MKKIKDFFNKNGMVSFVIILLIFFLSTCNKNRKIKRFTNQKNDLIQQNDSLTKLILSVDDLAIIKLKSELVVYNKINDEIIEKYKDRQSQITELQQKTILPEKNQLENKIKNLENDKR
jgi:predicted RND superfamily exporter protein